MRNLLFAVFSMVCIHGFAQDTVVRKVQNHIYYDSVAIIDYPVDERVFSPDFKEKYQGEDFVYEIKPREKNFWDRFLEWLAAWFKNLFNISSPEKAMNVVSIVLKTLAVLLVITVIYFIVRALIDTEGKWIFGRNLSKKIVQYDAVEKNLQTTDFDSLIKETIRNGESRLAVRYYYLWLLKKMSENEIIQWDPEKTNSDYLYEIKDEVLKDEFSYLSYLYNYIWYGEFELDQGTFEKAQKAFERLIQSIK